MKELNKYQKDSEFDSNFMMNEIFNTLISKDLWYVKIKTVMDILNDCCHCSMRHIYLQGYEGFYNYGELDEALVTRMRDFYFSNDQKYFVENSGDDKLIFSIVMTEKKKYGVIVLKIPSDIYSDEISFGIKNFCNIVARFAEADILTGELKASEMNYEALTQNSIVGVGIYQDKTVKYANNKLLEITQCKDSVSGEKLTLDKLFHPVEQVDFTSYFDESLSEDMGSGEFTFQGVREEGVYYWVMVKYSRIKYQRRAAYVLHVQDISVEVEAEKQKEKMTGLLIKEQKMKTMRNLVMGLSHEYNNVFAIIKGYVDLILYNQKEENELTSDLKTINSTINRGIELTNRMDVFLRHDSVDLTPIDLKRAIDTIKPLLTSTINKLNPNISLNVSFDDSPVVIMGDEYGLQEILHNLIRNSIDAIKGKGFIEIGVQKMNDAKVEFYVRDNGEGIPSENLDSIFDPFFTTKDPNKGIGLGLYVVYELVKAMDGSIEIVSASGKPTTCTMVFPCVD